MTWAVLVIACYTGQPCVVQTVGSDYASVIMCNRRAAKTWQFWDGAESLDVKCVRQIMS